MSTSTSLSLSAAAPAVSVPSSPILARVLQHSAIPEEEISIASTAPADLLPIEASTSDGAELALARAITDFRGPITWSALP